MTVADTGIGIPSEHLEHIFEPFFTTKQQGKGAGLGMAMDYGFVKQSVGNLRLTSGVARGTTVSLFLPAATNDQAEVEVAVPVVLATGGLEHVLLVEDEERVRRFALDQLIGLGYRVSVASCPSEALRLLVSDQPIDLLLTEVVMPEMSGWVLAGKARTLRPRLAVLFTSGYTQDTSIHQGPKRPEVLLANPYLRAELARKVREALSQAND